MLFHRPIASSSHIQSLTASFIMVGGSSPEIIMWKGNSMHLVELSLEKSGELTNGCGT